MSFESQNYLKQSSVMFQRVYQISEAKLNSTEREFRIAGEISPTSVILGRIETDESAKSHSAWPLPQLKQCELLSNIAEAGCLVAYT